METSAYISAPSLVTFTKGTAELSCRAGAYPTLLCVTFKEGL